MNYKDIKPGMMIEGLGLVIKTGEPEDDSFYPDTPWVRFFCYHDPFYGSASTSLRPEKEYTEYCKPGSGKYRTILSEMENEITENITHLKANLNTLYYYNK